MRRTALFAPHVLQSKNDEKQNNYVSCESCFWIPGNSERSNDLTNSWQSTIPCTLHVPCLDAKMASSIGPANLQLCEMRASFLSYLSSALLSPSEVNGEKDQKGPTRIKAKAYQSQTCIHEHTWSYMIIHGQLQRQLKTATTLTSSDRSHPFPIWTSRFAKAQLLAPVVALALARREASPAPKAPDSTVMFRSSGTRRMNGQDLSPMVTPDVSPSHMPVVILFSIVLISIENPYCHVIIAIKTK